MMRVLLARLDNHGDVLLTGPAVRAVAASGSEVVYLCRPGSADAARLLPHVGRILTFEAAWIVDPPAPLRPESVAQLVEDVRRLAIDQAVIFTSFHQSPLPLALLLRLAGVGCIAAVSDDYPGTLLDVRHRIEDHCHEVERNLSLVATLGYHLPPGDDGRLSILAPGRGDPRRPVGDVGDVGDVDDWRPSYVVVHPGASVAARALPPMLAAEVVPALAAAGWRVVITGTAGDWPPAGAPPLKSTGPGKVLNLVGRTDVATLAQVVAGAGVLIAGNTGPVHLAAAVGTPVVSVFAPTVALESWRPWRVPSVILGDQAIACRHCRSRICPFPGQPCTSSVSTGEVVAAVEKLAPAHQPAQSAEAVA
ncbi:MAG: glycosyltransferase family 9 protein [Acidimicrobiales bacterium]